MNSNKTNNHKRRGCVFALALAMLAASISGCKAFKPEQGQHETPTSVLISMSEPVNKEYDVSKYRIENRTFYEEPKTVIDKDQLKEYAESKLEKITLATDKYYVGSYQNHEFTIIGVDSFSEWLKANGYFDKHGDDEGQHLERHVGNLEYEVIDYFKDPSEKFLIVTNCRDYKVICEFFERGK